MGYVDTPQITDLLSGCACAIIFILLLSLDAWRAIKRKAYWFPAGFLALNALTLQFIYYVDYSTVNVTSGTEDITGKDVHNFLKIQLVIDSGRLVICVFIAYLIPRLVGCGFRRVSFDIGALALNVLFHMFHEIYLIDYIGPYFSDDEEAWFKVFSTMVFIAIILLVLLSICAVLAGKSICIIIKKKVRSELSCCSNSCTRCGNIGDHVLKCWIVVRSSQPEYIMARSVISSFAVLLVTVSVILMVVKWSCIYKDDYKNLNPLNKTTFLLQFIFALIGWIVVLVRWVMAVRYFPRVGQNLFQVEYFWKSSLIELKHGPLKGPLYRKIRNRNRTHLESTIMDLMIAVRLHTLVLSICLLLQVLIVLLSKASFLLSSILFWPLLMTREKIMLLCGSDISKSELSKYREVLKSISMPGEIAESLWIANESAFNSTKKHMEQGKDSTKDLIEMIGRLQRKVPDADKSIKEKFLDYDGQKSWKIRAASLIHFMLCHYDETNSGVVDDAFKACTEAWPLMDFVDSSDTEANLASLAADKEFNSLQNNWNKKLKFTRPKWVRTYIQNRMIEEIKSRMERGERMEQERERMERERGERMERDRKRMGLMPDSMDSMTAEKEQDSMVSMESGERMEQKRMERERKLMELMPDSMVSMTDAADLSLNKTSIDLSLNETSKAIDVCSAHVINNLACSLADVIIDCLKNEVKNTLIEKCNEWAVLGEETEIYLAAFITGKAMSVLDWYQAQKDSPKIENSVMDMLQDMQNQLQDMQNQLHHTHRISRLDDRVGRMVKQLQQLQQVDMPGSTVKDPAPVFSSDT